MDWWKDILPVEATGDARIEIAYHNKSRESAGGTAPADADRLFMVRSRLSRFYFLRKFFDYPLKLTPATLANLGVVRVLRIGASYAWARRFPRRPEQSLEDFLINRFGRELYLTFFRDYTEKVWGVPCQQISAEWGAQRIKGLSISRAVLHALKSLLPRRKDVAQKRVDTSLIERFLYPKFGPGQMWEDVARQVREQGGEIHFRHKVSEVVREGDKVPRIVKCELCRPRVGDAALVDDGGFSRYARGHGPACCEVCPRGAVIYGKRSELLAEAKRRLAQNPGAYVPKVYGETDAGGTQVLYLSHVPFEKLGLPDYGPQGVPRTAYTIQEGLYKGFIAPVVLYGALGAVLWRNRRQAGREGEP